MADQRFSVSGKVVIITGASQGIGKSMVKEFARNGAKLVICSRSEEKIAKVVQEGSSISKDIFGLKADVRKPDEVDQVLKKALDNFGRIDVLINNAGASFRSPVEDMTLNGWNTVIAINLTGVFICSQAVGKVMIKQGGGKIINISSIAGRDFSAEMSHYAAAKAGVISFTKSLAVAWAKYHITVNAIAPGPIETEGYLGVGKEIPDFMAARAARVPLKRWGKPEEIALPAMFLASDASSFMTGETICIDGGPTISGQE
ncbi:MAG: SDR family oxidoreductase [Candidatus Tectomicrobia bacterium]|uniref:SDR family oxidoreductase n=1 Tax=Tectimicrobiota bacterium TaxID=2528274 RepID=A0A933GL95_UNCTE|nr:SDR family oxidoreductase [Candidatus Tectomicrobia bacterium]